MPTFFPLSTVPPVQCTHGRKKGRAREGNNILSEEKQKEEGEKKFRKLLRDKRRVVTLTPPPPPPFSNLNIFLSAQGEREREAEELKHSRCHAKGKLSPKKREYPPLLRLLLLWRSPMSSSPFADEGRKKRRCSSTSVHRKWGRRRRNAPSTVSSSSVFTHGY